MSDPVVIETRALTKVFGQQRALDSVDLSVAPGAIGLLGPNGAGKSTFMKCLLQLQPITSGSAKLLGREVGTEGREIRKRVGYTPEQDCHIPGMVGCEYVTYCAQLCGLPFQAARQRAHEMLDFVGMGQERYRKVDTYSTGMKQRLKLAQAIVHDPEILFLDEPTNGLDPKGQEQILELVQSLWITYGMTVVLSSHLLRDVDRICEQIIIIARGRVLAHDSLENLKARRQGAAEVVLAGGHEGLQAACKVRGWACEPLPNGHLKVEHKANSLNPLLNLLHELRLPPLEVIPSPNALEEAFLQRLWRFDMAVHDTSYQHWEGVHIGLWRRRLVIARNGVTRCLQVKGMRHIVTMCWMAALSMTAIQFVVGQLLVPDGLIVKWMGNLNPQLQMFARLLTTWLEQHPETSVGATQNVLFYYFCTLLMPLNIFSLGVVVPLLITRDLASNAIIIYSSKAVSPLDYLLGKFATAFGLLTLTWLGPVCAAWFLGNLLAPDWRFFWHSRAVLGHILIFGLSSMSLLSLLALGVSAVSSKEKATPAFWFMWWIVGGVVAPIARQTQPWLQHVSFSFNLKQIAIASFHIGSDIQTAQDNIPILGDMLREIPPRALIALNSPAIVGAVMALLLMLVAVAVVIRKRVKPE